MHVAPAVSFDTSRAYACAQNQFMPRRSATNSSSRPTWKGSLKLSLITIPIQVFPATSASSDVSFRQLHRKCHTPINYKKWCPHCNEEVTAADIVKGYESSKGRMVVVEEEEIAKLRPESTKTVDVSDVVDAATIDPIYIERSYYVAPDGKAAGASFAVVRDALEDRAGIGRLALHGREYLVAIQPRDEALLLHTLRTAGEVRALSGISGLEFASAKPKAEEVKLARQVLDSFTSGKDLSAFTDHYQEALREMLEAKHDEEEEIPVADRAAKPTKVVNLMDALRQSLARAEGHQHASAAKGRKSGKMAKAGGKTGRVLSHPAGKRRKAS
jgi:DNA end-binding protein Ku